MTKAKLLVVEDEPNLLLGIRDILELDNYQVLTAQNGKQALEVLHQEPANLPDLIVSDIMMPHMDGIELLTEVRNKQEWLTIPFIFLTAKGEKADVQRGRKLGVDDYLIKPFDADDLLVAVEAKLRRAQAINRVHEGQVDSIKRNILTILNHEFRTPLTLVVAYADMLKEGNVEEMNVSELLMFLREINSGADRLRRLIENFILLVEIESGDAARTFDWRKTRMSNVDEVVLAAHDQIIGSDKVVHTCELAIDRPLHTIVSDREYLTYILRELLDNAVKFSRADKAIGLTARNVGDELHISVTDKGRGIPKNEFENIWQRFYQINRQHYEDQGSGSGLAIVKGLLEMHQGVRIQLTSTIKDQETATAVFTNDAPPRYIEPVYQASAEGSTFTLIFPKV